MQRAFYACASKARFHHLNCHSSPLTLHTLHKAAPTPEDMASKSARVAELERALSEMRSALNSMRADHSCSEADARAAQSRLRELEVTLHACLEFFPGR
jgi:hypothetical protein